MQLYTLFKWVLTSRNVRENLEAKLSIYSYVISAMTDPSISAASDGYLCYESRLYSRAMFYRVLKVIRNDIGFVLFRSVIGPENSHHFLNQLVARVFPRFPAFSRALRGLLVFTLSSH